MKNEKHVLIQRLCTIEPGEPSWYEAAIIDGDYETAEQINRWWVHEFDKVTGIGPHIIGSYIMPLDEFESIAKHIAKQKKGKG